MKRRPDRSLINAACCAAGAAVPFFPFGLVFVPIDRPFAALTFACGAILAACAMGFWALAYLHPEE